jgi:hypothetical protein
MILWIEKGNGMCKQNKDNGEASQQIKAEDPFNSSIHRDNMKKINETVCVRLRITGITNYKSE